MLEQPTEPFAATDLAERESRRVGDLGLLRSLPPDEELVFM